MLELTCPLNSTCHLEATRDHKQEKTEYLELMSEFQCVGVDYYYDKLELSVLGHYLLPFPIKTVLTIFKVKRTSKSDCRQLLQLAAAISISQEYF